jgi:hypothetical protein
MYLPYGLQLAHGWTGLALRSNAVAVVLLVPGTYILARIYGAAGAAAACIILNAGYLIVNIQLMHRRILPGQLARWYMADSALPLIGPLAVTACAWWFLPDNLGRWEWAGALAAVFVLSLLASGASAPLVRAATIETLTRPSKAADR